jgi:hypothetical protein
VAILLRVPSCPSWLTILSFSDFSAAQARSADADTFGGALHLGANRTQINVPSPPADIVGVTDVIPELRPLAAYITYLCHHFSR